MGMTEDDGPSPTAGFLEAFRARAGAGGAMGFDGFVDLALYNPSVGYYRRAGARVGRGPGTDFFTASSLGPLFGELLVSACRSLLGGRDPGGFTFVEIGVEAPGGVMAGVKHPFGAARTVAVAEEGVGFKTSAVGELRTEKEPGTAVEGRAEVELRTVLASKIEGERGAVVKSGAEMEIGTALAVREEAELGNVLAASIEVGLGTVDELCPDMELRAALGVRAETEVGIVLGAIIEGEP